MRKRINRLNGGDIFSSLIKIVLASTVMSIVAYGSYYFLTNYLGDKTFILRLIEAFVPIGLAGITFVIAAKLLRIGELQKIFEAVSRKLGRE